MTVSQNKIYQSDLLFKYNLGNHLLIYNPVGDHRMILLDSAAQQVFKICLNHTLSQVCDHHLLRNLSKKRIISTVSRLADYGFLSIGKPAISNISQSPHKQSLSLWLHLTNRCNFNCSYCYIAKDNGHMSSSVMKTTISNAVEQCRKHGLENLTIKFSGGEPLLAMDLLRETVYFTRELCSKFDIHTKFQIISNGSLIDKKITDFLKSHIIPVACSLDGIGTINDRQRIYFDKYGSFAAIDKGITTLLNSNWNPHVLVTITPENVSGLKDLTRYLIKRNLCFRYAFVRDFNNRNLKSQETKHISQLFTSELNKCFDDIEISIRVKQFNSKVGLCGINLNRSSNCICGVGTSYAAIYHDGSICSCQMAFNEPLGHVEKDGIIDCIRTRHSLHGLRERESNSNWQCNTCIWATICAGGCPMLAQKTFGTTLVSSPYCHAFKELIPRLIRIRGLALLYSQN